MRLLALAAVSSWLGIMGFLALAVAPAAFSALPREEAGRLVGAIFPRYYAAGAILGGLSLAALAVSGLGRAWRIGDWAVAGLVGLMLALTLYGWLVVLPAAHAAREAMLTAGPASAEALAFGRLHRLSTALNGAVIAAGLAAVLLMIGRRS